ncbi:(2Fe-2S) ferredoxin domain-containing protein [Janibacter cremeus]|uniref:(2Fe-2S) ferredoxin n=1 Tax=Janibacter cremeus TaxID=1285192 RepID=A0A852VRB8_9MICO|nr:(2Fe-2S) ferredoxin domain-containing protein [Janibacter cremeus]NYF98378.1 (2Fe-2S) ferredoxin [Janibacter cremeus]
MSAAARDEGGTSSPFVLVGMSPREAADRCDLDRLAAATGASVAFLQMADPSLAAALTRLADNGAEDVRLVAARLGSTGPANSWLRRIAGHWVRGRRAASLPLPTVHVATTMLRRDPTVEGVMTALRETRRITGDEAGLTSAAWDEVPGHRHHVLVCRGPRCTAAGSEGTLGAITAGLRADGHADDRALVTVTGCLFPCNHAPVVVVQPDDVWYSAVDPDGAGSIIEQHLLRGTPVAEHRLVRPPELGRVPGAD